MSYIVYHDIGPRSKEYRCERVEYKEQYVLLTNVCGDTIARQLCLSPHLGDLRVVETVAKLKVA